MKDLFLKAYLIINNKLYFRLLYLFTTFSFITALTFIPGINILTKISIAWGLVLVIINGFEIIFKIKKVHWANIVTYIFLGLTLVLTLLFYPSVENIKVFVINLMILTVFFSVDTNKMKSKLLDEFNILTYFYVLLTFILSSVSLGMILLGKQIKIILEPIWWGVENSIVYTGLFNNENALGISAGIALILSIYLIFYTKSKLLKSILLVNSIIQLATVVVSGGRSTYLALLALFFTFIFIYNRNTIFRIALVLIPIIGGSTWLFFNPDKIYSLLHGRETLWETAWILIKKSPFIGTGTSNLIPMMDANKTDYLRGIEGGGLHNIYIQLTTVNGIFAALIIIILFGSIFFFLNKKIQPLMAKTKVRFTILLALFLGIALINLMESSLLYSVNFICIIFWSVASFLISYLDNEN
ncbi:MAG: O-antigen ligase family protein [Clostridium sp.]|nr:O-antigen ligase family protein [Clostridium sp.]